VPVQLHDQPAAVAVTELLGDDVRRESEDVQRVEAEVVARREIQRHVTEASGRAHPIPVVGPAARRVVVPAQRREHERRVMRVALYCH
jgi:hypothetical protein